MRNSSVIVTIVFLIGLALGWYLKPETEAPVDTNIVEAQNSEHEEGLRKLQNLADSDFADYYRLKSMEEKYRKADELLGKMMTIFLADLGLKISRETQEAAATQVAVEAPRAESRPEVMAAVPQMNSPKPSPAVRINSRPVADLRTEEEIESFLENASLSDIDNEVRAASGVTNRSGTIEYLNGRFFGSANVMKDKKPALWRINFRFDGRLQQGKLRGRFSVRMSEDGHEFSTKSGDAREDFTEIATDPQAVVIEASPRIYLQIYYLKQSDTIIGNVYLREGRGTPPKNVGTLKLLRDS